MKGSGWHSAKVGDRWAALEPIRQGVRHAFGRFGKDVARGLAIRCDWGPQYIADAIARYNREWLIERLGHRTPAQARTEVLKRAA